MLKTRIITSLALVAVFIPALFLLNHIIWALSMLALSLLALYEWGNMVKLSTIQNSLYLAIAGLAGLFLVSFISRYGFQQFYAKSLIVFFIAALFWFLIVPIWFKTKCIIQNKCIMAVLGLLLIAPLWLSLICAKGTDPWLLLALLATIWIADSAAYFAGKNFGKHKLAPTISPGKTWEGVAGALIATTLFAAIIYIGLDFKHLAVFPILWLVTSLGVMGDLFESMIKRQAGIKDSGNILPGHGGILDRIDGIVPSLPIAILMIYGYQQYATYL